MVQALPRIVFFTQEDLFPLLNGRTNKLTKIPNNWMIRGVLLKIEGVSDAEGFISVGFTGSLGEEKEGLLSFSSTFQRGVYATSKDKQLHFSSGESWLTITSKRNVENWDGVLMVEVYELLEQKK